jgi:hypothetical protein
MTGKLGRGKLNWLHRIGNQKAQARERGEEISDEEARRREVAKLHRPMLKRLINPIQDGDFFDPRLYDGSEVVLSQGRVALPNCVPLEPQAVHAKRKYDKLTKQVARMIEQGTAQPEEIRLMCSEFFVFRHNGRDSLVQSGDPRYTYQIDKTGVRISYENSTVTFGDDRTIKVKSPGLFHYYLTLYERFVR